MERHKWMIAVAACLLGTSAAAYFVHYLIFGDPQHIFMFMLGDIAFVPVEVLLVIIIIERLLARREKRLMLQKLNMVIGTFFSELGIGLLGDLTACVENQEEIRPQLAVGGNWTAGDFKKALAAASRFDYKIAFNRLNLPDLRDTLTRHRGLLVMLLGNPNLLEHERFTDLLWAIFHLMEELAARNSFDNLPESDRRHLAGDVRRVCSHLTVEWLHYCRHLQQAYPYIFSIVTRTHPLQAAPDAVVRA